MTIRVAVIGATGFLGSHIAARWAVRPDATVVGLVRYGAAVVPAGVRAIRTDLGELPGLIDTLAGTDVVVNASAARTSAKNIVTASATAGVRRLIHISSVAVFGVPANGRVADDVDSNPASKYGEAKLAEENVIRAAAMEMGISVIVLRVPAVYGARMNGSPLRLSRWVQKTRPVPATGGRRSLMYVENLAAATEAAALMRSNGADTYVVEDGYAATPVVFAEHLASALGRGTPRVIPIPAFVVRMATRIADGFPNMAIAEVQHSVIARWSRDIVADGLRFRSASGFHPPIDRAEAMKRTAEWLRTGYSARPGTI